MRLDNHRVTGAAILLFAVINSPNTAADLFLEIGEVKAVPGSTVSVPVFASSTDGATLSAYNLPIEMGNDGKGLPAGTAFAASRVIPGTIFGSATSNISGSSPTFNYDLQVNDQTAGPNVLVPTMPTKLFDLRVEIDSSVVLGTVIPVNLVTTPLPLAALFNISGTDTGLSGQPGLFTFSNGSITAVPEPNGFSMLVLILCVRISFDGIIRKRRGDR